jgi:hypothetical protein
MAPQDPTGGVELDFEGDEWKKAKEVIVASGKSPKVSEIATLVPLRHWISVLL